MNQVVCKLCGVLLLYWPLYSKKTRNVWISKNQKTSCHSLFSIVLLGLLNMQIISKDHSFKIMRKWNFDTVEKREGMKPDWLKPMQRLVTQYSCFWVFISFLLLEKKLCFRVFIFSHHFASKISNKNDAKMQNPGKKVS